MRIFLMAILIGLGLWGSGCTTHSSGGDKGKGDAGAPSDNFAGDGKVVEGRWICALDLGQQAWACGSYSNSNSTSEDLQNHCRQNGGQPSNRCPNERFQVNCRLNFQGEDVMFRLAGQPNQKELLRQVCEQNGGQVQN